MTIIMMMFARMVGWFIWGLISGSFIKIINGNKDEWFTMLITLIAIIFIPIY